MRKCPVCDWEIKDKGVDVKAGDQTVLVCCDECAQTARTDPAKYAAGPR